VLVTSTSEIHGKNTSDKLGMEDDRILGSPLKSRWSYSEAKAIEEILAYTYWRQKGLPTVIVRLFNTVGPRQTGHYGMVVPTFVQQALSGRPIRVHGDGTQTRCFCHVDDVVRALVEVMELGEDAHGEVFNIGSQEEISIMALAERIREMIDSDSEIQLVPYEEAYEAGFEDMPRRYPDITKIGSALGWAPTRSLDEILDDVVSFHQSETTLV